VKPALEIQNVSKLFEIHHKGLPYLSFRDRITGIFKPTEEKEKFWALKDVSFDVPSGTSLGIIGKNGAGKSTLLKILSRITPPTNGRIIRRGRISSLLEVGTGFHQELTGRENIFMNGSILGMRKSEIKDKFDEIVEFSGVEKFLDTALKHYSSGMQLRLAFSVAAFLEPEILIVDEVLAVGDIDFQRKCLKKMEDVAGQGRTIIFVSHNMEAVATLCKTGVLLQKGSVAAEGPIEDIVRKYYDSIDQNAASFDNEIVKLITIKQVQDRLELKVKFRSPSLIDYPNLGFSICDMYGHAITGTNPLKSELELTEFKPATECEIDVVINSPKLAAGTYQLFVWFGDGRKNFFETKNPILFNVSKMANGVNRNSKFDGFVIPECKWTFSNID
jgi:lipopolysaccharide transport system ATP-binding protein